MASEEESAELQKGISRAAMELRNAIRLALKNIPELHEWDVYEFRVRKEHSGECMEIRYTKGLPVN